MKKIFEIIQTFWGNLSIKTKLILITLTLVLVPLLFFCVYLSEISVKNAEVEYNTYLKNVMEQSVNNVENRIDNISYVLSDFSVDEQIQEELKEWNDATISESRRLLLKREIVSSLIFKASKIHEIRAIYLEAEGQEEIVISDLLSRYTQEATAEDILEKKGSNLWQREDTVYNVIPISKQIYDNDTLQPIACLTIFVEAEYFTEVLESVGLGKNGRLYLLDRQGAGIAETVEEEITKICLDLKQTEQAPFTVSYQQYQELMFYPIEDVPWTLMGIVDLTVFQSELDRIIWEIIGVFSLMACLLVIISIQMSKTFSYPIQDLQDCMEKFSSGDFRVIAPAKYNDEIGDLRRHFNKMAQEVERLIKRVYVEENLRQKAQIDALQMQINPHFLYNTLDTVNWMAESSGQRDIAAVTRSLAALMRYSLRDDGFVPVEEELDAVDNYIRIQHYRYGDSLHLQWHMEEEVLYEHMPKHIVLPLLENAVEHGLKNVQGDKYITVYGAVENETVRIAVQDNGEGITEEKLRTILQETGSTDDGHMKIGLRNVNQRLQMIYGEAYGLQIESQPQQGCIVTVIFPAGPAGGGVSESGV